jgi:sugar/nucleoside kinase (ribokinase family)
MNYWISSSYEKLSAVLNIVDGIIVNEEEAFLLTGEKNIVMAAEKIFRPHFKMVILKKGANGVMVFGKDFVVSLPSFPLRDITDPTGAGDSFAGAFISYLDRLGTVKYNQAVVKNAAAYATVVASFAVEGYGVDGLNEISKKDINKRLDEFRKITACK